ncbi:MAG: acyclic terpene utilization AtuA family protein [Thermodesulfobacteriota bacterium]|nr:acyclic terpene utilization AtuA family protein [Thermodesulfobacteriota bacterium]
MKEIRILSPNGILGYGFPLSSFEAGLNLKPDVIAVDAGSIDPGPYYLGAGVSFTTREEVKRDLVYMLRGAYSLDIPVLIGTAGGAGAKPHVDWVLEIVDEVLKEEKVEFRRAVIYSDVSRELLLNKLKNGKVNPLSAEPPLNDEMIHDSERLVAQIGVEAFIEALEAGANLIIAGRSLDVAEFAAFPIWKGFPKGLAIHLGKILECGAIAAEPGSGRDCLFGILRKDHFLVYPTNQGRRCTKTSVAAHSLYEKEDPLKLWVTDGCIDISEAKFEELDERTVKVSGSRFVSKDISHLKVEGVRFVGFRFVCIAGSRDPYFISSLLELEDEVKREVRENFPNIKEGRDYSIRFVNYGIDGVMGELEPRSNVSHEVGIVMEVVGKNRETAKTILASVRSTLLHIGFEGRRSTAGNLAILFSPSDFDGGKVYEFSVHHLMEVDSEKEVYKTSFI